MGVWAENVAAVYGPEGIPGIPNTMYGTLPFSWIPAGWVDERLRAYSAPLPAAVAPLPLGEPEPVVIEETGEGIPGLVLCPDGRFVGNVLDCLRQPSPRPPIDVPVAPGGPATVPVETIGDTGFIPPETAPTATVHESTEDEGDTEVAVDWGDILGGAAVDVIQGWTGAGGTQPIMTGGFTPNIGPPVINPTVQVGGKPQCKRRRRRRLLTEGDFNDLMRIATLPNKQNVTVALAKAVGRR